MASESRVLHKRPGPISYGIPRDDSTVSLIGPVQFELWEGRIVPANPGVRLKQVDKALIGLFKAVLKTVGRNSNIETFRAVNFIAANGEERLIIAEVRRAITEELDRQDRTHADKLDRHHEVDLAGDSIEKLIPDHMRPHFFEDFV